MNSLTFISVRQLLARKRQTALMLIGIVLGSAGYIVISGFLLGFREYLVDQLVNSDGHVKISARVEAIAPAGVTRLLTGPGEALRWFAPPAGRKGSAEIESSGYWIQLLETDPDVYAFSPQFTANVIFRFGKFAENGKITGINTRKHQLVTTIADNMIQGKFSAIGEASGNIVVGAGLRDRLGLRLGENLTIANSRSENLPYRVVGFFETGNREIDETTGYGSLGDVQALAGTPGRINKISIRLHDLSLARAKSRQWGGAGFDRVQSWDEANANFLSIFRTQDILRYAVSTAILLVAGFGIYNILTVIIGQKKREIAILRSMGFEPRDVLSIFLIQGLLMGVAGGLLGMLVGWFICARLAELPFQGPLASKSITMQISFAPETFLLAFALAAGTTLISSVFPARAASRLSPIDTIRGE